MINLKKLQNPNNIFKQKTALAIGKCGCYFSCIIKIAEKITGSSIDIIDAFYQCNKKGWIDYECFVKNPDKILSFMTGKKIYVSKTNDTQYKPNDNEIVIGCFKWNKYSHFVVLNSDKKIEYDPLENSNTAKNGTLESLRIIKIED